MTPSGGGGGGASSDIGGGTDIGVCGADADADVPVSSNAAATAMAEAQAAEAGGGGGDGMDFDAPGVELVSPDVSEPETGFSYEGGVVPADEDSPGSTTDMPDEVGNGEREDGEGRANGISPGVRRSNGPSSVTVQ